MPLTGLLAHGELLARLHRELGRRRSQGYLFHGPRGIGKEMVAEGLVLGLLCERQGGLDFCCTPDQCPNRGDGAEGKRARQPVAQCDCCAACVQMARRVHPDFDYIALMPKRSYVLIEQVRELIAHLGSKPARGPVRAAIVDDAETLNLAAQNALLKTLEEPPGYAVIFLIAENANSLLDTVRSRLRLVRFAPLAVGDIEAIVVARAEVDPERAAALARLARGSAGRALKLAGGAEPPIRDLLNALGEARRLDFAQAQALAQEFFASREQAAENFELIARVLEEILCLKLMRTPPAAAAPEIAETMAKMAESFALDTVLVSLKGAVEASAAIDEMANPRMQAEQWWMTVRDALGSQ